MAIFKKKTEKTKTGKESTAVAKVASAKGGSTTGKFANVLIRPHVTEKAALLAEKNTYVFKVSENTNKIEIAKAIRALYGVNPIRVNIINLPKTNVLVRGKMGVKSGVRKALVTLAKTDKIELI